MFKLRYLIYNLAYKLELSHFQTRKNCPNKWWLDLAFLNTNKKPATKVNKG